MRHGEKFYKFGGQQFTDVRKELLSISENGFTATSGNDSFFSRVGSKLRDYLIAPAPDYDEYYDDDYDNVYEDEHMAYLD